MLSLPTALPRDGHNLWYTPSYIQAPSTAPTKLVDPEASTNPRLAELTIQGRRIKRTQGPAKETALAALAAEETNIRQRKQNLRRFGAGWLHPPGVPETYQAMLERRAEQEEQKIAAARAAQMEALIAAQNGRQGETLEAMGEGEDDEGDDITEDGNGDEVNLDDNVPDMDTTVYDEPPESHSSEAGSISDTANDHHEHDLDEDEEHDLDADVQEGDSFQYNQYSDEDDSDAQSQSGRGSSPMSDDTPVDYPDVMPHGHSSIANDPPYTPQFDFTDAPSVGAVPFPSLRASSGTAGPAGPSAIGVPAVPTSAIPVHAISLTGASPYMSQAAAAATIGMTPARQTSRQVSLSLSQGPFSPGISSPRVAAGGLTIDNVDGDMQVEHSASGEPPTSPEPGPRGRRRFLSRFRR